MCWKLNLKSRCFIRYFIKGDILYFYQYFVEGMSHWNFPNLLESLYSLEISQNSPTIKTGKFTVKSGCL